jgi:hypothetical protein
MSTTTSGPSTPVVRRTIPSGSVNTGVFADGVIQPLTHVAEATALVGGGTSGTAGGVGEPVGEPEVTGVIGGAVDDPIEAGGLPSHAASAMTSAQPDTHVANRRKRTPDGSRTPRIPRAGYR